MRYIHKGTSFQNQILIEEANTKIIKSTLTKNNTTVNIYATYRTHAINKEEFIRNVNNIVIGTLQDQNHIHVLTGDLNVGLMDLCSECSN